MSRFRRGISLCFLGLALIGASPGSTSAAGGLALGRLFESPAVDGTIWCVQEFGGELIVGGLFDGIGREPIPTLAAWNGSSWRSMGLELSNQHRVYCMAIFEGDLVVGTAANDPGETYRVFRLVSGVWEQLGGALSSAPRALAVHEGELFVGLGTTFTARGERPLHRLVGNSWTDAGYPSGEEIISIHALVSDGTSLYVGGSFDETDVLSHGWGAPRIRFPRSIYEWSAGAWTLLGGGLESDTEPLSALIPQGAQGVHDLAMFEGELYATGSFVNESRNLAGMARWTGSRWAALPTIGVGRDLVVGPQGLVATGLLAHDTGGGGYRYFLAAWDGSMWKPLDPATNASPLTTAAGIWGGQLVFARDGAFSSRYWADNAMHGPGLTLWDDVGWSSPIPGQSPGGQVLSFIGYGGELVVGGLFEFAGITGSPGVARFDGVQWHALGKGLFPDAEPSAVSVGICTLIEYQGYLVAGGRFFASDENQASGVAFWDGSRWGSLAPGTGGGSIDGFVRSLAIYGGQLYAGGRFSLINGITANGIARFNGAGWEALADNDAPREIRALEVFQGELIAGGVFGQMDGVPANGLARFDGGSWSAVAASNLSSVADLAVFQQELYIARSRDPYPGPAPPYLLVWNGVDPPTVVIDPSSPDYFMERAVVDLLADGNELHLIAYDASVVLFEVQSWDGTSLEPMRIRDEIRQVLGRWNPSRLGNVGGDLYLGGRWSVDGDVAPQHLARLKRSSEVAVAQVLLLARPEAGGVLLRWELEHLPAISGMSIEHSAPGADWQAIWRTGVEPESSGQWFHERGLKPGIHRYRAIVESFGGNYVSDAVSVTLGPQSPRRSAITSIAPNPFNPATNIEFSVAEPGPVLLRVYDISGRVVRTVVDEPLGAGSYSRVWNGVDAHGRSVASGVYLLMLETGGQRDVRRVALLQ